MRAFIVPFAVVLVSVCAAQTATFIGNCAFRIELGDWLLYSDFPYQSGYSDYDTYELAAGFDSAKGTAMITHAHLDHFDSTLFAACRLELIAAHRSEAANRNAIAALKERGIHVRAIPTEHASMPHNSYIVEWDGRRLYFTGDTESTDALLEATDLDVAFVTPWLIDAVNRKGRSIDAALVIMYHHEAGAFDGREVKAPCQNCDLMIPRQGEVLPMFR
jgi:L-ascorbate metabolism protein UlaG (beta-lactamase superfamily)